MPFGPRGASATLALAAAAALAIAPLASCSPPSGAPVFISDAVFAALRPDLEKEARRAGFRYAELGAQAGEAELMAALGREAGSDAALSPMLAGSVVSSAVASPGALYGLAFEGQVVPPAVIPIRFSRADGARAAANWLLSEAKPTETIAAMIAGRGAEKAAEAFSSVFIAAKRAKLPIVEWTESDWSEGSAALMTASEASWVYLAAPAGQEGRWIAALPDGASVLVEASFPSERAPLAVRAWASWDIEASLRDAGARAARPAQDGPLAGRWKVLAAGRKRRF